MPAVGNISTNLSLSDVAVFVAPGFAFFTGRGFTTTGFCVVSGLGFTVGFIVGLGFGFTVAARVGTAFGVIASVEDGPLPLRPSITIFPSWV
jgi:hypothetical protein